MHGLPMVPTIAANLSHGDDMINQEIVPVHSETALGRCLEGALSILQETLRVLLVGYALCISGIFALFAIRRAEGNMPLSVLFGTASVFYNVFGALMFGKRVGGFLSESWKRTQQKDLIYLSFWISSLALAGMTAMAGVKISEDSVSILSHDALIKSAVSMFVFNTLSTRWAGGLDLLEKVYKEIRYNAFDRFFQDWKKYDGLKITEAFSPNKSDSDQTQLITYFYDQLTSEKKSLTIGQELYFYSDKIVKMMLGVISLPLLPMWISLTANGLRAIDENLEGSAPFTITCAFSNLPFYFLSCFNLYPNIKSLLSILAQKFDGDHVGMRNVTLTAGFFIFLALAIVSGGGYGMEVKSMVEKGYGKTAHAIFPDAFFNFTNAFASDFAMTIAGLVNFANTAKFFADVLTLQSKNPSISLLRAMVCYMNLVKIPTVESEISDVASVRALSQSSMAAVEVEQPSAAVTVRAIDEVSDIEDGVSVDALITYTDMQRTMLVADTQAALSNNQFDATDKSALCVNGETITAQAITEGRSKWRAATAWCCSWFSSAPKETTREAQLAESLIASRSA